MTDASLYDFDPFWRTPRIALDGRDNRLPPFTGIRLLPGGVSFHHEAKFYMNVERRCKEPCNHKTYSDHLRSIDGCSGSMKA